MSPEATFLTLMLIMFFPDYSMPAASTSTPKVMAAPEELLYSHLYADREERIKRRSSI